MIDAREPIDRGINGDPRGAFSRPIRFTAGSHFGSEMPVGCIVTAYDLGLAREWGWLDIILESYKVDFPDGVTDEELADMLNEVARDRVRRPREDGVNGHRR